MHKSSLLFVLLARCCPASISMLVISLGYLSFADFCRHYCRVPVPPGTSWNCVSKISGTWKVLEMSLVLESPTGRRPIRSFSPGGGVASIALWKSVLTCVEVNAT